MNETHLFKLFSWLNKTKTYTKSDGQDFVSCIGLPIWTLVLGSKYHENKIEVFSICLRFRNIEIEYIRKKSYTNTFALHCQQQQFFSFFSVLNSVCISDSLVVKYVYLHLRFKVIFTAFKNSLYFASPLHPAKLLKFFKNLEKL